MRIHFFLLNFKPINLSSTMGGGLGGEGRESGSGGGG